jgi:hypothetical protein
MKMSNGSVDGCGLVTCRFSCAINCNVVVRVWNGDAGDTDKV